MLEKYVKIWKKKSKQFWLTRSTTWSKLLAALCLCFAANVSADDFRHFNEWTSEEKSWVATNAVLSYVDYRQTMWMVKQKHPNGQWMYEEANPMFPKRVRSHQIGWAKVAAMGLQYYAVGKYGFADSRVKWSIIGNTVLQGAVVAHNHSIGVSVSVTF